MLACQNSDQLEREINPEVIDIVIDTQDNLIIFDDKPWTDFTYNEDVYGEILHNHNQIKIESINHKVTGIVTSNYYPSYQVCDNFIIIDVPELKFILDKSDLLYIEIAVTLNYYK